MDWVPKVATAKRLLDKFGVSMQVVTMIPGEYSASDDFASLEQRTYDTIGVIVNPKMVSETGVWSKSNRVRVLLNASALPTLDAIDFKVIYGNTTWNPDVVAAVKPGGTTILYIVDMK